MGVQAGHPSRGRAWPRGCAAWALLTILSSGIAARGQAPAGSLSQGERADQTIAAEARRERLEKWLRAVATHEPGRSDGPAVTIGTWTDADLSTVRADFFALSPVELLALLPVRDTATAPADVNHVLLRAAILHADIALRAEPFDSAGCSPKSSILALDGASIGSGCVRIHWGHARALLDRARPSPATDTAVRLWYQATIAVLLERWDYANVEPQIERARLLYPEDADILFEHGYFHETLASPMVEAIALASAPASYSAQAHLKEAERMYRAALKSNPELVEARVRHGRVLTRLGRGREAVDELTRASRRAQDSELRYYAQLFLGDAQEALGSPGRARDHYAAALQFYPQAQSPRLALSLLAARSGDRAAAQQALVAALSLGSKRPNRSDPWWDYYTWQARSGEALLAELYRPFRAGDSR